MNETQRDILYLLTCVLNGITPDAQRVQAMQTDALYRFSNRHMIVSMIAFALESSGVKEQRFNEKKGKAIRKNLELDMERKALLDFCEQEQIWYLPLKGCILKDLYPKYGMRQMSDNDILFDSAYREKIRDYFVHAGYAVKEYEISHHDVYLKEPVSNFEMHTALFDEMHKESFHRYYADIKRLMQPDSDHAYGYHLSDEDFYVYLKVHEYKHFFKGGTGIRSLTDTYVYCKEKSSTMDWEYICQQTDLLEITAFEQQSRELAMKVFSAPELPELTEDQQKMLCYYLGAGTYGTLDNEIKNQLKTQNGKELILQKMFPSPKRLQSQVKFVREYPVLYPVGIVYRWGNVLVKKRGRIKSILKAVKKYDK